MGERTERWQDRFDIAATVRGAELVRAGAVRLHPDGFANVRDGRTWDCHVTILPDGREVAGCTCMIRQESGPCAHLWAMFLAMEAEAPS